MELAHDAGGARIEQSRKKTCSTTMAWPQCAHTKVGTGTADGSSTGLSADSSGDGGATCNNSRASARLSLRLPLASSP